VLPGRCQAEATLEWEKVELMKVESEKMRWQGGEIGGRNQNCYGLESESLIANSR